jgi:hypothetical protein
MRLVKFSSIEVILRYEVKMPHDVRVSFFYDPNKLGVVILGKRVIIPAVKSVSYDLLSLRACIDGENDIIFF